MFGFANRSILRKWGSKALFLLMTLSVFSQASQAQIQLGNLSFAKPDAPPLDNPTQLADGLKSHAYLGQVGGVAFGGVAAGLNGLKVVALEYVANNADGKRLRVTVQSKTGRKTKVAPRIYDWQWIPIARFAATDQDACFTLFGKLKNEGEQRARRSAGQQILNYHPALVDSLLGLRLFQADILIIRSDACDLPKVNGKYVFGNGEAPLNLAANRLAFSNFQRFLDALNKRYAGKRFRSYVICDSGQNISFRLRKGDFEFTGAPVWHCWRLKSDDPAVSAKVTASANAEGNRVLNQEYQQDIAALGAAAANTKWTKEYQKKRHFEVFDAHVSQALLVQMPAYSKAVSIQINRLGGINPAIYNSLLVTMRYAALFRHFKEQDSAAFAKFVEEMRGLNIAPSVETPTVMIDPKSQ